MSLTSLFENDTSGDIKVNSVNAASLLGAGNITSDLTAGPSASGVNTDLGVTITKTLITGEVYLVLWQAKPNGDDVGDPYTMEVTFEKATAGELIFGQTREPTTTLEGTILSGFTVFTIAANQAGAGKVVRFDVATLGGTQSEIEDAKVVLIRIA